MFNTGTLETFSDGSMATAFLSDGEPYAAFFDSSGTQLANSPLQISNNQKFSYVTSCKASDDSIMIILTDLTPAKRMAFYSIISKSCSYTINSHKLFADVYLHMDGCYKIDENRILIQSNYKLNEWDTYHHIYTISDGELSAKKKVNDHNNDGHQLFPNLIYLQKPSESKKLYSVISDFENSKTCIREIDPITGLGIGTQHDILSNIQLDDRKAIHPTSDGGLSIIQHTTATNMKISTIHPDFSQRCQKDFNFVNQPDCTWKGSGQLSYKIIKNTGFYVAFTGTNIEMLQIDVDKCTVTERTPLITSGVTSTNYIVSQISFHEINYEAQKLNIFMAFDNKMHLQQYTINLIPNKRKNCSPPTDTLFNLKDGTHYNTMPAMGHFTTDQAYAFDCKDSTYATFPTATFGGAMTFSFHGKFRTWQKWQRFIDFGKGKENYNILFSQQNTLHNQWTELIGAQNLITKQASRLINYIPSDGEDHIKLGKWNHFIHAFQADGTLTTRMDGEIIPQIASTTKVPIPNVERSSNLVGKSHWFDNIVGRDHATDGLIDELLVYNYTATPSQIDCLLDKPCAHPCLTCEGTLDVCLSCIEGQNREMSNSCVCLSTQYEDDSKICQNCSYYCTTCTEITKTICSTCDSSTNHRKPEDNCPCEDTYYDDGASIVCQSCSFKCAKCTKASNDDPEQVCTECKTGRENRSETIPCNCNPKHYEQDQTKNCLPCKKRCAACTEISHNNSSQICTTCNSDPNRSGTLPCDCNPGYYEISDGECQKCDERCSTCTKESMAIITEICSVCKTGIDNRSTVLPCNCDPGYHSISNNQCQKCPNKCYECSDENTCISCKQGTNRQISNHCDCLSTEYADSSDHCKPCPYYCSTCENDGITCKTCSPEGEERNRILGNNKLCSCLPNFYDKTDLSREYSVCLECDYRCLECDKNSINDSEKICTICNSSETNKRKSEPPCECLDKYYDIGGEEEDEINCSSCKDHDELCLKCHKEACTHCEFNRVSDESNGGDPKKCVCAPEFIQDVLTDIDTQWCTTCNVTVVKPYLTANYKNILIEFPIPVDMRNYRDMNTSDYNTEFCELILQDFDSLLFGYKPQCKYASEDTKIIDIQLGRGFTININDPIELNEGILHRKQFTEKGCTDEEFFEQFINNTLKIYEANQPSIILKQPTGPVSLCEDINIEILTILNDGFRGLTNFNWTLDNTDAHNTNKTKLQHHLLEATHKNQGFLKIDNLFLQEKSYHLIKLKFENHFQQSSTVSFFVNTTTTKGTSVIVPQTEPFIFSTWKQNEFIANMKYLDCSSGSILQVERSLEVIWEDTTPNPTDRLLNYTSNPQEKQSLFQLEKYKYSPGSYNFSVTVYIKDDPEITSSQRIQFKIKETPLTVYILGGNRMHAYSSPLELDSVAKDLDVGLDLQVTGITLSWDCKNLAKNEACKKIDKSLLTFNQTLKQNYEKKIFEPYNSYQFQITGTKGEKEESGMAIIVIVETNLPQLSVAVPKLALNQKVNKKDDLEISINYEHGDKDLFYSLIIIYKFEVVATKSYYYNKFAFRIWDLYNDFQQDENQFLLRISLYDPQFFMPQQTSFQINLNFEPSGGKIELSLLTGTALETEYQIEVKDLFDQDQPFSYKYFYYSDKQSYQKEVELGSNQLQNSKNLLKDFSNQNTLTTILPRADFNTESSKFEALIMVSVSDSLGAIKNLTQIVEINPPSVNQNSQISNIQELYEQSKKLEQQKQIQILNILSIDISKFTETNCSKSNCSRNGKCKEKELSCTCKEGFFASDCSISDETLFTKMVELKKSLYNKLQELVNKQTSTAVQDQIQKSLNYLMQANDLTSQYSTEEISSQIGNTQSILQQQNEVIENLISQNLLNQGDNKITRKNIQAQETIGKSVDFLDKLFLNLNNEQEKQAQNNNKTRILQENLNNIKKIYDITKNTSQLLNKVMLPNADPFTFQGKSIYQEIAKNTKSKVIDNFFGSQSKLSIQKFQDELLEEQSPGIPESVGNILENTITVFSKNPFQQDPEFPYPNQFTQLQDMSINEVGNLTSVQINQPYPLSFDLSNEGDKEAQSCISKEGNVWKGEFCETVLTETDSGKPKTVCECKSLNPTTVIADVDNIFKNSEVNKVFSQDGLSAFVDFNFWESYIFYIYIFKLFAFVYFIYRGINLDKKDSIIQQIKELNPKKKQKENNIIEKQIEKIKNSQQSSEDLDSSNSNSNSSNNNFAQIEHFSSSSKQNFQEDNTPITSEKHKLNQKNRLEISNNIQNPNNDNAFLDLNEPTNRDINPNMDFSQQYQDEEQKESQKRKPGKRKQTRISNNKTFKDIFQPSKRHSHTQSEVPPKQLDTLCINFTQDENRQQTDNTDNTDNDTKRPQTVKQSSFNNNNRKRKKNKNFQSLDQEKLFDLTNTESHSLKDIEKQENEDQNSSKNLQQQCNTQIRQDEIHKNQSNFEIQEIQNLEELSNSPNKQQEMTIEEEEKQELEGEIQPENDQNIDPLDNDNEIDNGDDVQRAKKQKLKDLKKKLGNKAIKKELEQSKYRGTAEALFRLHQLFGIFLVYEEELSRPKRFVLYYLRIHILLALTALFSQNMGQLESLTFSLLSALILGIPVLVIKALLKKKKKFPQIIGSFLYILMYLTSVYSILVQAALMGVAKSNEWSISYFTTYCVDTFMFESIGNFFKVSLLRHEIIKGQKQIMRKIFGNKDIISFIENK